jgi:hypothetical protein
MSEKRRVIARIVKDARDHPFLLFGPLLRFRLTRGEFAGT